MFPPAFPVCCPGISNISLMGTNLWNALHLYKAPFLSPMNTRRKKKLLNSGKKNVLFSFGTANYFHLTAKIETDLLIKVWSLQVTEQLQKPSGTTLSGCFPGFSFPLISSRETYVNITEQVLISNWKPIFTVWIVVSSKYIFKFTYIWDLRGGKCIWVF